jgi:hypothetical protein
MMQQFDKLGQICDIDAFFLPPTSAVFRFIYSRISRRLYRGLREIRTERRRRERYAANFGFSGVNRSVNLTDDRRLIGLFQMLGWD